MDDAVFGQSMECVGVTVISIKNPRICNSNQAIMYFRIRVTFLFTIIYAFDINSVYEMTEVS